MSSVSNYYDSLSDAINGTNNARKVSYNSETGTTTVVNEGNSSSFQSDELGKDQFLQLLIAQLQYQDPLDPASDTEFITQLAQFSQLEYTQNSTNAISSLASSMVEFMELQTLQAQSITNSSATPLLGKEVRVMEASFEYDGSSDGKELNIHLLGTKNAVVVIRDSEGNIVSEINVAAETSEGGDITAKWDGTNQDTGNKYLSGTYTIEVVDASTGSSTVGYAYQEGVVSGVSFSSGGAGITVNGVTYGLGYLINVEDSGSSGSGSASSGGSSSSSTNYNVSDETIRKIAEIMSYKDNYFALEKIAEVLGVDESDNAVNQIAEILNRNISEEDMIKRIAEVLGDIDSQYDDMISKVIDALNS